MLGGSGLTAVCPRWADAACSSICWSGLCGSSCTIVPRGAGTHWQGQPFWAKKKGFNYCSARSRALCLLALNQEGFVELEVRAVNRFKKWLFISFQIPDMLQKVPGGHSRGSALPKGQ